jgi:hypothetical protein
MEFTDEQFWSFVKKTDRCWEWLGARLKRGYGNYRGGRRKALAHRYSWEMHFGPIPDGLWVLHKCDNPGCVRPDHLFLGTHLDNMADMTAKGRSTHGERGTMVRLTEGQVREIHARYATGKITQKDLAADYGISRAEIGMIVQGKCWQHLGLPPLPPARHQSKSRGERHGASKLTNVQAEDIRRKHAAGQRVGRLALEYGVSHSLVSMIISGKVRSAA